MAGAGFENKKMQFDHKDVLRQNLVYMCSNTKNIVSICIYLRDKGVITLSEEETIMHQSTTELKAREMITGLQRREIDSYKIFKDALRETKNDDVLNKLSEFEK